jgi:hypothetical protein
VYSDFCLKTLKVEVRGSRWMVVMIAATPDPAAALSHVVLGGFEDEDEDAVDEIEVQ